MQQPKTNPIASSRPSPLKRQTRRITVGAVLTLLPIALAGCPEDPPPTTIIDNAGIFGPLGGPMADATSEQRASFDRGRDVATRRFTPEDGLGPEFNTTFCGSCHEKPLFGGSAGRYRNFLIVAEELPDGTLNMLGKSGVQVQYRVGEEGFVKTDPNTNLMSQRNPIPFFGVGRLAEIPEEEILRYEDPNDADGDGISGRANYDRGFVGRFGRKAQTVSIEGFIRGPLFNHLGLTSDPLTNARKAELPVPSALDHSGDDLGRGLGEIKQRQAAAPDEPTTDDDGVADPELSEADLFDLVSFAMLLAAPQPEPIGPATQRGHDLFSDVGCSGCHVPQLTGPRGAVPAYSDLLVHDMGPELADGLISGVATGSEFRTQPLWGITAVGPYLHDGRADTLHEAINWHGGEGSASRDAYQALSADDQNAVVEFLESLGGRFEKTEGLIPPGAGVPDVGTEGGPWRELSPAQEARFLRGRSEFDRDRFLSEGLGEEFNGDSCRACHFDPVVGGAGPSGVDVVRQGILDNGSFVQPAAGTLVHRHAAAVDERPPYDEAATHHERRQTPSLLGAGRIDAIQAAAILALADPDDLDSDGISGKAHVLGDGRLGRFGWKANVPSLLEFTRDASSAELGLTIPVQAGQSLGLSVDGDAAADPELNVANVNELTYFMAELAPPPRRSGDTALIAQGDKIFRDVGCASCHVPSLPDHSGNPVALYSDLLLHETSPTTRPGIEEGDASMWEFRTPPLWGISTTAPYLHDGAATTLAQAILAHAGEATDSRDLFESLAAADRQALLAFLASL